MPREIVSLDGAFAYYINRAYRALRIDFLKLTKRAGYELTPEQYFILNKLFHLPGQSQSDLASELNDRANITRGLEILERKRLVHRTPDPEDGRKVRVSLTEQGQETLRMLNGAIEKRRKTVYAGLSEKDLKNLKRILERLEDNLLTDD